MTQIHNHNHLGRWKLRTYYEEYFTIEVMSYKHTHDTQCKHISLMVTNHHRDRVDLLVISYNL